MELWDVYDLHRNMTATKINREYPLGEGEYYLAVQVCIFNSKGEMLIQHRQPFKDDWANMWDMTSAGSAVAGENSQQAVHRELLEELGIDIDFSNIRPRLTINFDKGFCDVFTLERDINLESVVLQEEEVQAIKWANREQILEMIDKGEFITYYKSFIELLFDSRKSYGSHKSESRK